MFSSHCFFIHCARHFISNDVSLRTFHISFQAARGSVWSDTKSMHSLFFSAISAGILPGILHDRGKAIKKAIHIHVVRNTRPIFFLQDIAEML